MSLNQNQSVSLADLFSEVQKKIEEQPEDNQDKRTKSFKEKLREQLNSLEYLSLFTKITESFKKVNDNKKRIAPSVSMNVKVSDFKYTFIALGISLLNGIIYAGINNYGLFLFVSILSLVISLMSFVIILSVRIDKRDKNVNAMAINNSVYFSNKEKEMLKEIIPHIFIITEINKQVSNEKIRKKLLDDFLSKNINMNNELDTVEIYNSLKETYESFFLNSDVKYIMHREKIEALEQLLEEEKY